MLLGERENRNMGRIVDDDEGRIEKKDGRRRTRRIIERGKMKRFECSNCKEEKKLRNNYYLTE